MLALGLRVVGGLLIALGILWMLQGSGVLGWPASSFMIGESAWTLYGAVTVATGVLLMFLAARRG